MSNTDLIKFREEIDFKQPVTSVKWLTGDIIIASTNKGQILVWDKNSIYDSKCLYEADGAAIWDI